MKHLLSLLFCSLLTATAFSQHIDTLTSYEWQNNAWQPTTRLIYTYNGSCLITETLFQNWQTGSSSWADTFRINYTYLSNDSVDRATTQIWNGSNWENSFRQTYSYGDNGLVSQILFEQWKKSSSKWVSKSRSSYSYSSANLVDSILTDVSSGSNWTHLSLTTNTYNGDNTLNQTLEQFWLAVAWANVSRITYTYNGDKTVSSTVVETADLFTQIWSNTVRNAFTYNGDKLQVTDTAQSWDGTQWNDSALAINTYNGSQLTNTLNQTWSGSAWVDDSQVNYTYNGDGTFAEIVTQNWDGAQWVNDTRETFHYSAACTLPLTLLDFTATLNGKTAQLQWITVTEINTKNFVVQRGTDGVHFTNIGTVNASGNSTQKITYQFSDGNASNAGSNKVYYRLQMVDNDGKFTYSKIAMITITANGKLFVVYPNPVKDKLTIISNVSLSKTEVRITDVTGKLVQKQQLENVQAGVQNNINVASLNKGVYYLQFVTGGDAQTVKFFKY